MKLYSAKTSQAIDRDAIENYGIPGILLMKRAGWFAFQTLQQQWPNAKNIHIVCGTGNNGGDGFVIAQYALINGFEVSISLLGDQDDIKDDALVAFNEMQQAGIQAESFSEALIEDADVIVDAIFGTGLCRSIQGQYAEAIETINCNNKAVLAIDIASGINADSGAVQGIAVKAQHTCTFITQKLGLCTAQGEEHCGKIHFSSLFIDTSIYNKYPSIAENQPLKYWLNRLPSRQASHHKGTAGTACLVGGNKSMMGAIQLAGLASLKSGAGLTKVVTHSKHAIAITQAIPELMCYAKEHLDEQLNSASAIGIGPGLGEDNWSGELMQKALQFEQPKVIDADALKALKEMDLSNLAPNWVLTPHPGEAAFLLDTDSKTIQNDRIKAIKSLHEKYGGVVVLKGNGTLIFDGKNLQLCMAGNAGMAVGGMGDVLTGAITSFLAQGLSLWDAANLGVSVHAHAGDIIAGQQGEPSITPSDVSQTIGQLLSYSGSSAH